MLPCQTDAMCSVNVVKGFSTAWQIVITSPITSMLWKCPIFGVILRANLITEPTTVDMTRFINLFCISTIQLRIFCWMRQWYSFFWTHATPVLSSASHRSHSSEEQSIYGTNSMKSIKLSSLLRSNAPFDGTADDRMPNMHAIHNTAVSHRC